MDTQSEYAVTSHLLYDTDHATYVHTLRTVRELDGYYIETKICTQITHTYFLETRDRSLPNTVI